MASIAEIPSEEAVSGIDYSRPPAFYSNRSGSLDESSRDIDENSNTIHSSLSRAFSENMALKKPKSFSPKSFSPKSILKKMW